MQALALVSAAGRLRDPAEPPRLERSFGRVALGFVAEAGLTRIDRLYQEGCGKARLPGYRARPPAAPAEAVLLNTAGGLTGGDRLAVEIAAGEGSAAVVTTQAAERVYRTSGGAALVETRLEVGSRARLDWLPQETILFDRSALSRRIEADVAGDGTLLLCESVVLGRAAMGETVRSAAFSESWRLRRAGRLVHADGTRLLGDPEAILAGPATGGGAGAFATIVLIAPDAEGRLEPLRSALAEAGGEVGASAWNGLLVARFLADGARTLRADLARALAALRDVPLPRVWAC